MRFEPDNGWLACETSWCAAAGMTVSLWQAEQQRAQAAGVPQAPGRRVATSPRSGHRLADPVDHPGGRRQGMVPAAARPAAAACQTGWLCQMCGETLDRRGWVVANRNGHVVSSAAMHRRCLHLAARSCPHLAASTGHVHLEVIREVILADGTPLPAAPTPLVQQRWRIAHEAPPTATSRQGTGGAAELARRRGSASAGTTTAGIGGGTSPVPHPARQPAHPGHAPGR